MEAVSEILSNRESDFPPAECILEDLTICFECNNSVFDNVFYLHENGTAMGPHMSCSYSDISMYKFDIKALNYRPGVQCWKRSRVDIFCPWDYFPEELQTFFEFMNNVDATGKIKFTMFFANESILVFSNVSLHIDEHNKICMNIFAKPTKPFTYVLPSTCYPKKKVNNVHNSIVLRLRRICNADGKFDIRSSEYQNYLIARDYKPTLIKTVSSY